MSIWCVYSRMKFDFKPYFSFKSFLGQITNCRFTIESHCSMITFFQTSIHRSSHGANQYNQYFVEN